MREKKYANVLNDDFSVIEESKIADNEEKLSMTRELKFKDLQESIDNSRSKENIVNGATDLGDTEEVVLSIKDYNEIRDNEKDIEDELNDEKKKENNEDIYLTTSFKPFKKRFKLRKVFKFIFMLLLIVLIFVSLFFFIILPLYNKYQSSKPKAIFDATLNYIGEQLNSIVDVSYSDSGIFNKSITIDFNSNIEELNSLNSRKLGLNIFNDLVSKSEAFIFIEDEKDKYGFSLINDGNDVYYKFTSNENFLKTNRDNSLFSKYEDYFNISYSKNDLNYYIDTNINILKEIITEDLISSERDEIEVNGESLSVMNNSLKLDKELIVELEKKYNNAVLNDEKLMKIVASLYNMSLEDVKKSYENVNTYDDDYSLIINIYTIKGNEFVGFDIEENGFRNIYYYINNGNFEGHLNLNNEEDCLEVGNCLLGNQMVIDLVGIKKGNHTEVQLMINNNEICTLEVRSFNHQKIDFNYKLNVSGVFYEGTFTLDIDKDKEEYNFNVSIDYDSEYLNIMIQIKNSDKTNISEIDLEHVINYNDTLFQNYYAQLEKNLENVGLLELLESNDFLLKFDDN